MAKKEVEITEIERGVLKKYSVRYKDIAGWMSMGERVFLNSSAKDRYVKGVAQVIIDIEKKIKEKI